MRQTQLNAYCDILESGRAATQRGEILLFLLRSKGAFTLNEISQFTGIRLSSVSARVNELVTLRKVLAAGKRQDRLTMRTNTVWSAATLPLFNAGAV